MEAAIIQRFAYTNQPDTGIRHALMETDSDDIPSAEESLYMQITCSAFVNYLKGKASESSSGNNMP